MIVSDLITKVQITPVYKKKRIMYILFSLYKVSRNYVQGCPHIIMNNMYFLDSDTYLFSCKEKKILEIKKDVPMCVEPYYFNFKISSNDPIGFTPFGMTIDLYEEYDCNTINQLFYRLDSDNDAMGWTYKTLMKRAKYNGRKYFNIYCNTRHLCNLAKYYGTRIEKRTLNIKS